VCLVEDDDVVQQLSTQGQYPALRDAVLARRAVAGEDRFCAGPLEPLRDARELRIPVVDEVLDARIVEEHFTELLEYPGGSGMGSDVEVQDAPPVVAALREAITNAVMHRDYFQAGANVFVEIYSDRIEVTNPGGLPKGLAPADLGTVSVRRNLLVADLLHRIGYIEKAGTGIRRMREDAERHGCPEPQFKGTGFFTAVFRPRPRPEQLNGAGENAAHVGTKSGPSATPRFRPLSQGTPGIHGACRTLEPNQVPGPGRPSPARDRLA
jgi:hypothetical protein